jgi:hypothetical protein
MKGKKLNDLPPTSNGKFWVDAETQHHKAVKIKICKKHSFIDNKDGTISCKFCPYGTRLPGYMRLYEGKIVDLRSFSNG